MLNLNKLGHRWFDQPDVVKIDALLIHEYAHHYSMDHLSSKFYDACCSIGARMKASATDLTFPA